MSAPRGDQLCDRAQNKRCDNEHINQIGEQHQTQAERRRALIQRTENKEGCKRQKRPQHDKAERGSISRASGAA